MRERERGVVASGIWLVYDILGVYKRRAVVATDKIRRCQLAGVWDTTTATTSYCSNYADSELEICINHEQLLALEAKELLLL